MECLPQAELSRCLPQAELSQMGFGGGKFHLELFLMTRTQAEGKGYLKNVVMYPLKLSSALWMKG